MTSDISELPMVVPQHDGGLPCQHENPRLWFSHLPAEPTWPSYIAAAARAANPAWPVQSSGLSQPVSGADRSSTEVELSTTRDRAVDRAREPLGAITNDPPRLA